MTTTLVRKKYDCPPGTDEEELKGTWASCTWGLMMGCWSYKRPQKEAELLKGRLGGGFWCNLDVDNTAGWEEKRCEK